MFKFSLKLVSNYKKTVSKRTIKFIQNSRSKRMQHSLYSKKDLITTTFLNKFKQTEDTKKSKNKINKFVPGCLMNSVVQEQVTKRFGLSGQKNGKKC